MIHVNMVRMHKLTPGSCGISRAVSLLLSLHRHQVPTFCLSCPGYGKDELLLECVQQVLNMAPSSGW